MIPPMDEHGMFLSSGLAILDEGELFELFWKRFQTEKWYFIFIPADGFFHLSHAIEQTYYKDDRNKGFEIIPVWNRGLNLLMCYKDWMSTKQLADTLHDLDKSGKNVPFVGMKDGKRFFEIPEGKDIAFLTVASESEHDVMRRMEFMLELNDYITKQQEGT